MSNPLASEPTYSNESREMGGKRGARDEGNENEEISIEASSAATSSTLTTVSTVPATTDQFMLTNDFKRLLVGFVQGYTLMTLRLATKAWKGVADAFVDEGVRSGKFLVHDGKYRSVRMTLITRVIFLQNITQVGKNACKWAANLVVVEIPEGVVSIGKEAFQGCASLTTVSFPTMLKSIGSWAFQDCRSLENVDLLHTNLQELGEFAFWECVELKSMTIPDSLQTFGDFIFHGCSKLIRGSNIDVSYDNNEDPYDDEYEDTTVEVVEYFRAAQQ
ncbi:hypothetical protein TL16_g13165 [Triparma laevis f. inornata]|uniref:Uncharacterized protein n=2 Tax=Triparma laevis TaxID=1534972 RepID=A0A9W7FA02_9STRA|nr:hypothetical protein TL16_g13165 [Triparma laevis f. inornata]GMI08679.1 hypothetical protein TrLO_g12661 [Triparma laevis f. longispina]